MSEPEARTKSKSLFWPRCSGLLVSLGFLLLLQWLEFTGWLPLVNGRIVDQILRLHSSNPESAASQEIFTIGIDDKAYHDFFRATSPMNPDLVLALVTTVADANPKIIGVDIRTEGHEYTKKIDFLNDLPSSIVWISAFKVVEPLSSIATFPTWLFGAPDRITVSPLAVLGSPPFALPNRRQMNWGIPLFPRDEDDSVRRFPRTVSVLQDDATDGGNAGKISTEPSWAARIAGVYCQPRCQKESADEVYISYAGTGPHEFSVSDLFSYSPSNKKNPFQDNAGAWDRLKSQLLGKIVLIGGTFSESGDFYRTPRKRLSGLEINAYAVKAELDGNGLQSINQPTAWILDLLLGLLIVAVCDEEVMKRLDGYKFVPVSGWKRKKIVLSTAIVFAVCVISFFPAHGRYLLGFAGEGVGVLIDRMRDLWEFSKSEIVPEQQPRAKAQAG